METPSAERPVVRERHVKRTALLVLAGLVILMLLTGYAIGRRHLNAATLQAKALGPITLDALEQQRRNWPEDQDAGPVFARIAQAMNDEEQAWTSEQRKAIEFVPLVGDRELPPTGHLWNEEDGAAARAHLQDYAALLEQLDGLRAYAGGRLPLEIAENPIETLLPSLSPIRRACKLECLAIMDAAMAGRVEDLTERVEVVTRLRQMIDDQPLLVSVLVAIAMDGLLCNMLERALGLDAVRREDLPALRELLAGLDPHASIKIGVLGERAVFLGTAEALRKGKMGSLPGAFSHARIPLVNAVFAADLAYGLRKYNQLIATADDSATLLAAAKRVDQEMQQAPMWAVYTRMLMPSISRAVERSMQSEAQLRATRIGLAIEQYRLERGSFPETLEALVPAYLKEVPPDPFEDKAMRYLAIPEGVVVYSVGMDRQDDGGQTQVQRYGRNYDVGFRVLAPEFRRQPPMAETQPGEE